MQSVVFLFRRAFCLWEAAAEEGNFRFSSLASRGLHERND